jgi:hypothetical protein
MGLDSVRFRGRMRHHDVEVTLDGPDLGVSVDGHTTRGRAEEPVRISW